MFLTKEHLYIKADLDTSKDNVIIDTQIYLKTKNIIRYLETIGILIPNEEARSYYQDKIRPRTEVIVDKNQSLDAIIFESLKEDFRRIYSIILEYKEEELDPTIEKQGEKGICHIKKNAIKGWLKGKGCNDKQQHVYK